MSKTTTQAGAEFFNPARCELLKWLAFASMVCDHVAVFLGDGTGPLRDIGRFAFPVFALTFGIGLAASRDPLAMLRRLILPGIVAELAWRLSGHSAGINVLLGFALVGWCCVTWQAWSVLGRVPGQWAALGLLTAALFLGLEGGVMTVALVAGSYYAATRRSVAAFLAVELLAAGLYRLWGVSIALCALLLARPLPVPRFRWFAWAYAVHIAVLATIAAL